MKYGSLIPPNKSFGAQQNSICTLHFVWGFHCEQLAVEMQYRSGELSAPENIATVAFLHCWQPLSKMQCITYIPVQAVSESAGTISSTQALTIPSTNDVSFNIMKWIIPAQKSDWGHLKLNCWWNTQSCG